MMKTTFACSSGRKMKGMTGVMAAMKSAMSVQIAGIMGEVFCAAVTPSFITVTIIPMKRRTFLKSMTEGTSSSETLHLTKSRLESLSDGIFAFAMTLLVISINLPDKSRLIQSQAYATQLILSLYSDFFHYVLAFLILGAFWLSHHILTHPVKTLNRTFIWLNLGTLLFVSLLPFSTSFAGDFPDTSLGAMVFEANLLAIGLGMFCQWKYATSSHRLVEAQLSESFIRNVALGTLVVPGISLLGILIALTGNLYSQAVYLLLPFVAFLRHQYYRNDRVFSE